MTDAREALPHRAWGCASRPLSGSPKWMVVIDKYLIPDVMAKGQVIQPVKSENDKLAS